MYNDLYEDVYNEGYMEAYLLNEISEPIDGYADLLKQRKLEYQYNLAKYGPEIARGMYRADRKADHSEAKPQIEKRKQEQEALKRKRNKKIGIGAGVGAAAIGTGLAAYKLIKSNKKKKQAYEEYKRKGGKADYKTFKKTIMKECYEVLFENYDIILEMGLPLNDYDYMILDEIYEDNLYDNYEYEDAYEDIYNEGYEAAILTESIFDEKGYTKYVAKCKAKGKTPLPFKEWKRNNIIKTVGASTAAIGLAAGGLKVGSDYKNYKKGKEKIKKLGDENLKVYDANTGSIVGHIPIKNLNKRDIINLGKGMKYYVK